MVNALIQGDKGKGRRTHGMSKTAVALQSASVQIASMRIIIVGMLNDTS